MKAGAFQFFTPVPNQNAEGNIPYLYDVTLLHWSCDVITLTGFERVTDEKGLEQLDHAQTGFCAQ